MSDFKVSYTKIKDILPHNNADSLELAMVYGFQVIIRKGSYSVGDKVFYLPIDSILPADLESLIFPKDSKVRLSNSRVRQIRLRGLASQGMVLSENEIQNLLLHRNKSPMKFSLEEDYASLLGVSKYEPPTREVKERVLKPRILKARDNPFFHAYNGLTNFKWQPDLFKEGEEVVIEEKLHGSSVRASVLPMVADTLWKKLKKLLGLLPNYERCYGSNNVQLQNKTAHKGFYGEDVYGAVLHKVDAFNKIRPNETIYGELVGQGIQKNYDYGHKDHHFVLFDVKILQEDESYAWLDPEQVEAYAKERGFDMVPLLYRGGFSLELAKELTKGDSAYCPTQKIREGVVIKKRVGYSGERGTKIALKLISEAYLDDKNNTDFH